MNHYSRKADSIFNDYDEWRAVSDRDRRDLFDDVIHMLAKREKVNVIVMQFSPVHRGYFYTYGV